MQLIRGERTELDPTAVDFIATRLAKAIEKNGKAILGLPGGRSVSGILEGLVRRTELDWSRVHVFLADERKVPVTSPESNYRQLKEQLFAPLSADLRFPAANGHAADSDAAAYSEDFATVADRFDVLVLGAGEDGHVASLFPRHPGLRDATGLFIDVENSPKPPPRRISVSTALLTSSSSIVVLFLGEGKWDAMARFSGAAISDSDCPARLARACSDLLVLTDAPADTDHVHQSDARA